MWLLPYISNPTQYPNRVHIQRGRQESDFIQHGKKETTVRILRMQDGAPLRVASLPGMSHRKQCGISFPMATLMIYLTMRIRFPHVCLSHTD